MLTDNQNKLIEDIRKEFSKMNTPTKAVGGGLINRAEMDANINVSIKRRAELQCITDATHKAIRELMDMDMERLNYDLVPMGMIAKRSKNNEYIVRIYDLDKQCQETNSYETYFQYEMNSVYENMPDKSSFRYNTGFHRIRHNDYGFNSIDAMCKHDYFIRKIEEKYKLIINQNKCK
jgi:hypothetical protein